MSYRAVLTAYDKEGEIVARFNGYKEYYNKAVEEVMVLVVQYGGRWVRFTVEVVSDGL